MTRTPTDVAASAADRFRVLREQATAKLAKARTDTAALRDSVHRESQKMMADAKRRKEGEPENPLVSPWPDEQRSARYGFDDRPDDTDRAEPDDGPPPRPTRAAQPARADDRHEDDDHDDNHDNESQDTWLR